MNDSTAPKEEEIPIYISSSSEDVKVKIEETRDYIVYRHGEDLYSIVPKQKYLEVFTRGGMVERRVAVGTKGSRLVRSDLLA